MFFQYVHRIFHLELPRPTSATRKLLSSEAKQETRKRMPWWYSSRSRPLSYNLLQSHQPFLLRPIYSPMSVLSLWQVYKFIRLQSLPKTLLHPSMIMPLKSYLYLLRPRKLVFKPLLLIKVSWHIDSIPFYWISHRKVHLVSFMMLTCLCALNYIKLGRLVISHHPVLHRLW